MLANGPLEVTPRPDGISASLRLALGASFQAMPLGEVLLSRSGALPVCTVQANRQGNPQQRP